MIRITIIYISFLVALLHHLPCSVFSYLLCQSPEKSNILKNVYKQQNLWLYMVIPTRKICSSLSYACWVKKYLGHLADRN